MPGGSKTCQWDRRQLATASLLVVLQLLCCGHPGASSLSVGYYDRECPYAESLVREAVSRAFRQDRLVAGAMVRLHFHDCMVQGCDGSVLLDSTARNDAEKAAPVNAGLRFFNVIDRAKAAVEAECPGVVSCADIVAFAARDAVRLTGGPHWDVEAGRLDGTTSSAAVAQATLPTQTDDVAALAARFRKFMGLSLDDMVTLSGSHTLGQSLCVAFSARLRPTTSPLLPADFAARLRRLCPVGDNTSRVDLDFTTPVTFDSNYYRNLRVYKGVLKTDQELFTDTRSRALVEAHARDEAYFFSKFRAAMLRMGRAAGTTPRGGREGQVRLNCRCVN